MEDSKNSSGSAADKTADEVSTAGAVNSKVAGPCSVTSIYKTKIGGAARGVTVVWTKTLINHSLAVSVDGAASSTCRIDLKPWPFWGKKGFKSLDVDGHRLDLFWDLRSAKFSGGGGPEPTGGYYVALVYRDEVVLLLGDCKKDAYKRTKSRPSLDDAAMVSKRDNVFGKRCFSTRARFDGGKKEHDILVENSISGGCGTDPEMWIRIDGVVVVHVSNLKWKFRGNETVLVERSPVQVFWDVHDWLFCGPGTGHALFVFKPGAPTPLTEVGEGEESACGDDGREVSAAGDGGGESPEFCFFLYAWKVE
ncbi:hypothetical protein HPP92_003816 [Vanilla planifolia]|uniref:DUF868 family protein n=1 Tax=Vanilla planifolia TaxID=51239 RepID=A0A835S2H3_VANPL|nr:hypothetical protein HPP92_003816 [Vanilla planifolia]